MTNTMGRVTVTKTCPNDVSGIVWAIGKFSYVFFLLFFFFGKLINFYSIYNCSLRCTCGKSSDDENGPKQMCLALFGP